MAAESIGIPVLAGPIEATALGNIALQLLALGEITSLAEGKEIISQTEKIRVYEPVYKLSDTQGWQEAYGRFEELFI